MPTEISKQESDTQKGKTLGLLELDHVQAEEFFIKRESYCGFELPPYFCFEEVLQKVAKVLKGKQLKSYCVSKDSASNYDDVNHVLLTNKDGKYAWRPFTLIHPALYYSLVDLITGEGHWKALNRRFRRFQSNPRIQCLSLPVISLGKKSDKAAQILTWWQEIEQRSIELSLDYAYMAETDITDCYGSVYTHSLAWAVSGKKVAKANSKKQSEDRRDLLGDKVDVLLQGMSYGQTNGIPQGSVLMDFVAEIVLGYADLILGLALNKSGIEEYHILRYRDDYRIFTNHPTEAEQILKILSEILHGLGFKLHPAKTTLSNAVIRDSIKPDKLDWLETRQFDWNLQKHLLLIHGFIFKHLGSGHSLTLLKNFLNRLERASDKLKKKKKELYSVMPMIGIAVDIAILHPRTHPLVTGILSVLLANIENPKETFTRIKKRLDIVANNGHLQIWLQRISSPGKIEVSYTEPLCHLVECSEDSNHGLDLWNSKWIKSEKLRTALKTPKIINKKAVNEMTPVIPSFEVDVFDYKNNSQIIESLLSNLKGDKNP